MPCILDEASKGKQSMFPSGFLEFDVLNDNLGASFWGEKRDLECATVAQPLPDELPFAKRHNLYQRVKKCLRTKVSLYTISLDS